MTRRKIFCINLSGRRNQIIRYLITARHGIALRRIFSFLQELKYTLSLNSSPQILAGAYTFLPLATRLYAISLQRTSKSHCGVYFPSFRNRIIRYLITAHLGIALRRILPFLQEPDYTPSHYSAPRNRTAAYNLLPLGIKMYAISLQRTSKSHCAVAYIFLPLGTRLHVISQQSTSKSRYGVYFPSFRNQIIRWLSIARLEIALRRIFSFLQESKYTLSHHIAPRNRTAAYTLAPLGTGLYAISSQRTSESHYGVYFHSFRN